jgi:hypothetical protein
MKSVLVLDILRYLADTLDKNDWNIVFLTGIPVRDFGCC